MFTRELQSIKINHIVVARITNITDGYCIQYISPTDQHSTFIFTSNIAMLLLRECEAGGYMSCAPPSIESLMCPPISKLLRSPCDHKLYLLLSPGGDTPYVQMIGMIVVFFRGYNWRFGIF